MPITSRREFEVRSNIDTHGIDWAYEYELRKLLRRGISPVLAHGIAIELIIRFA